MNNVRDDARLEAEIGEAIQDSRKSAQGSTVFAGGGHGNGSGGVKGNGTLTRKRDEGPANQPVLVGVESTFSRTMELGGRLRRLAEHFMGSEPAESSGGKPSGSRYGGMIGHIDQIRQLTDENIALSNEALDRLERVLGIDS